MTWKLIKRGSDAWSLPVCEWSLNWKRQFDIDQIEINIERDGITHIADVVSTTDTVIKFQNRWLDVKSLLEREAHFGKMVWIFKAGSWDIDLVHNPKYYTGEHGRKQQLPAGKWMGFICRFSRVALASCKRPVFLDFGDDKLYWFNWQNFEGKLRAQFDLTKGVMKVYSKQEIINKYKLIKATPPTSDQTTEEAASKI